MVWKLRFFVAFCCVFFICQESFAHISFNGYAPPLSQIDEKDSKNKLLYMHGPPALEEGNTWYYVRVEISGIVSSRYNARTIAVQFDKAGLVEKVSLIEQPDRPMYKIWSHKGFDDGEDTISVMKRSLTNLKPYL